MRNKKWQIILILFFAITFSYRANAQVSLSINFAPPALISYDQPECPGDGYMWIPGYWAYSPETGYYWVPGYWTLPPAPGLLWTPGYWGYDGNDYVWNAGYWGNNVGFYGGINYGYGYFGTGFVGGMWNGNTFQYNTAVVHIGRNIRNTYSNRNFSTNNSHASFNGRGGVQINQNNSERQYAQQQRYESTPDQRMQRQAAISNTQFHYQNNNGQIEQQKIDNQNQNYQNFKQQHQSEPEFKNPGRAVPMNNGNQGGGRGRR
ncbi:YXWGXW repeat-containing protein [Rhizosphaericola mali]|uniref:BcpO-related WXXGXW repeat protein n=1 Tax=Rhizosphaericola mali TaxID=2545455 RepID=A0A5P2G0Q6_9BACT|nr:YXWGXW repeat-containing protein [Rhizosphaericola mali]QES89015.1 hypothetical protein E0W69_010220 [Rhizosphaericola mali]